MAVLLQGVFKSSNSHMCLQLKKKLKQKQQNKTNNNAVLLLFLNSFLSASVAFRKNYNKILTGKWPF